MPFQKAHPVSFPYLSDLGYDKNIASVEKLDDYTVRFTLHTSDVVFVRNIAMEFASIVSAQYADQLLKAGKPEDLNQKPVGTGPFVFRDYQKDATIRYDAHPDFWNKKDVHIAKLVFAITPDAAVRMQKLASGECQMTSFAAPRRYPDRAQESESRGALGRGFQRGLCRLQHHAQAAR